MYHDLIAHGEQSTTTVLPASSARVVSWCTLFVSACRSLMVMAPSAVAPGLSEQPTGPSEAVEGP